MKLVLLAPVLAAAAAAALAQGAAEAAGPAIGYGAAATSAAIGGTWFVRYVLGRFDKLDSALGETREDVAAIMGALNIDRARK